MRNRNQKGLWFPDTFLEYIQGYFPLNAAVEDGLEGLRKILDDLKYSLFPTRQVPWIGHPGYSTNEHDYFYIEHPDPVIRETLEKYFISRRHIGRDTLYEGRDSIADFFTRTIRDLYIYGKAFYSIEWQAIPLTGTNFILPKSFNGLNALTVRKNKFREGYIQRYSFVTYKFGAHFKSYWDGPKPPRIFKFTEDEILVFKFPFAKRTPVRKNYRKVSILRRFWKFGLDQQKASLEPDNHSLPFEEARYAIFTREKREYSLLKSKVRKSFGYILDTDLSITQFYDVYVVARYKKYLNNLRNYYVKEFNEQILKRVAQKNGWDVAPILTFEHFQTNDEVDQAVKDFVEQKMDVNGFTVAVVKKP